MENIRLAKEDIIKIYDELDRRMERDIKDYLDDRKEVSRQVIKTEYRARLQGVYGTIKAIVPNDNWCEIVHWLDEIEAEDNYY